MPVPLTSPRRYGVISLILLPSACERERREHDKATEKAKRVLVGVGKGGEEGSEEIRRGEGGGAARDVSFTYAGGEQRAF